MRTRESGHEGSSHPTSPKSSRFPEGTWGTGGSGIISGMFHRYRLFSEPAPQQPAADM
ncbi:hypothetical protein GCM10027294_06130 [Marinactinospora endophytica]